MPSLWITILRPFITKQGLDSDRFLLFKCWVRMETNFLTYFCNVAVLPLNARRQFDVFHIHGIIRDYVKLADYSHIWTIAVMLQAGLCQLTVTFVVGSPFGFVMSMSFTLIWIDKNIYTYMYTEDYGIDGYLSGKHHLSTNFPSVHSHNHHNSFTIFPLSLGWLPALTTVFIICFFRIFPVLSNRSPQAARA